MKWPGAAGLACLIAVHAQAHDTTSGSIALENLEFQISQHAADPAADELWLMRARYLADYDALERGARAADLPAEGAGQLLRRARARAAVHRFNDALADLAVAEREGANTATVFRARAPVRIAQGAAAEVIPALEAAARNAPGFATASALATAYAGAERYEDADREFATALAALDTTAPFPYAWLNFARGTMWAEQAGDAARGAAYLEQAVAYLPQFVAANLHLAEIDARAGRTAAAERRLVPLAGSGDPEVLALLGTLHGATDPARGQREIATARDRFELLLARQPLAFADHAAEFYLGAGADPDRALRLADANLAERNTRRARSLAERARNARSR
jgi:hypothetical protein